MHIIPTAFTNNLLKLNSSQQYNECATEDRKSTSSNGHWYIFFFSGQKQMKKHFVKSEIH